MSKSFFILLLISSIFLVNQTKAQTKSIISDSKVTLNDNNSIDLEKATKFVRNYKKKWKVNRRIPVVGKKYDARTCWFSVDMLQKFIDTANIYAKQNYDTTISGVRFYYMAYPKGHKGHGNSDYSKSHSLIMVATVKMGTGKDEYQQDLIDTTNQRAIAFNLFRNNTSDNSLIRNNGTLCPPLQESYCKTGLIILELADGTITIGDVPSKNLLKKKK